MLKKIFKQKNKKTVTILVALLAAGVLLMMAEGFVNFNSGGTSNAPSPPTQNAEPEKSRHSARASTELEARLEEALGLVAGAGRVRVLINFSTGRELVLATDQNTSVSVTQEEDSEGGTRYQHNRSGQYSTVIITDRTGESAPLVLKELEPQAAGVIIIAEGGDDIFVRDALTRAASTLLGIDLSRVQVLQMRTE